MKNTQLYDEIETALNNRGSKVALYFFGKKIKAKDLLFEINSWANILKYKYRINRGDVVTMNLPNIPNAIILFYAVNKCGAILDIVHPLNPIRNIIKTVSETNSKLFITLDRYFNENRANIMSLNLNIIVCRISDYLPQLKSFIYSQREPVVDDNYLYKKTYQNLCPQFMVNSLNNNIAVYLHSSGTTGEAKTVVLSNNAISELKNSLAKGVIDDMSPQKNKSIMVLPLFHGFGFGVCMHAMLSYGFEIALMPKFEINEFANLVAKRKVTICAGVPTMFAKLLKLPNKDFIKLKSLEHVFVGGEKLSEDLKRQFDKRLKEVGSNAELIEGYGLTETVTVCCVNKKGESSTTSVGHPLIGVSIKIIDNKCVLLNKNDVGEICIGGPTLMEGYLDNDDNVFLKIENKKYVRTGDIGYLDDNGNLHFIERKKRIFKISGITIFPNEIEKTIMLSSKEIENCVVLFVQNNIVVFIQSQIMGTKSLKAKILDYCKLNLIRYAIPKEKNILIYRLLPINRVGKIDVKALEKEYRLAIGENINC